MSDARTALVAGINGFIGTALARCLTAAGWRVVGILRTGSSRDRLMEVPVTVAPKPADGVWLQRVERPSDAQKQAFQAWLGTPWIVGEPAP